MRDTISLILLALFASLFFTDIPGKAASAIERWLDGVATSDCPANHGIELGDERKAA